jgi:hypothetical protein
MTCDRCPLSFVCFAGELDGQIYVCHKCATGVMLPDYGHWYFWRCPAAQRPCGCAGICVECDPLHWDERPGRLMVVRNRDCTHSRLHKKWRSRLARQATHQRREREADKVEKQRLKELAWGTQSPRPTSRRVAKKQDRPGRRYKHL